VIRARRQVKRLRTVNEKSTSIRGKVASHEEPAAGSVRVACDASGRSIAETLQRARRVHAAPNQC